MNTAKKGNQYKLLLQELALRDGSAAGRSIAFEFSNHDDIMALLDKAQREGWFEEPADNVELVLGIKLFGEVMLRQRKHPLFADFFPAFRDFMRQLKDQSNSDGKKQETTKNA